MKKVLLLVHDLNIGGVATSLINVTRLLVNNDCEVTVKTTSREYKQVVLNRIDKRVKVIIADEKRYPLFERLPYFRNFYESGMWTRRKKARDVYNHFINKKERNYYDVEIAFYYGRPVKAISGSSNSQSKKIMWLRLGFLDDGNFAGFKTKEEAISAFNLFDKIIGVSEDVCDDFIHHTGIDSGKVVAIHNYLDKDNIDNCLKEPCELKKNCFTISCVCRLEPIKNLFALLSVINRLQKEGFDCGCWFIGDGSERSKMETFIKEQGLKNVVITGYTKNPHKYVKSSDLYVFPSLMEGYPNTIADSIYIGTPIVSSKCIGASNILRNGKYGLLTGFDEQSIYDAVKLMITNKEVYNHYKNIISELDFEAEKTVISKQLIGALLS